MFSGLSPSSQISDLVAANPIEMRFTRESSALCWGRGDTLRHTLPHTLCKGMDCRTLALASWHSTKTMRRFQCQKDLLTSRRPNFSNSYTINVLQKIAQKRREIISQTVFWYPALIIVALILFFVFCIVSVAHANPIKERVWLKSQSPFEKENNLQKR